MAKEKILIIEDDGDIAELIQYNLEREGYQVWAAMDGMTGLSEIGRLRPDLVVLDLMLPGLSGLDVCRKIRASHEFGSVSVIMVTAKGEESDMVLGLEIGADDYMTKPFSPRQLVARVRAVLRRGRLQVEKGGELLRVGPLTLDLDRHEAKMGNNVLSLTLAEYKLLVCLASRPGRVFSREQLLDKIAGKETYVVDRNVDVHIRSIRKKLGDNAHLIVTVRGVGYKCDG